MSISMLAKDFKMCSSPISALQAPSKCMDLLLMLESLTDLEKARGWGWLSELNDTTSAKSANSHTDQAHKGWRGVIERDGDTGTS